MEERRQEEFSREVALLKTLRDRNIVQVGAWRSWLCGRLNGLLVVVRCCSQGAAAKVGGCLDRSLGRLWLTALLRPLSLQFIGACLDGPTPMLVTEFLEFGDLWRALPLKNAAGQRIFAWHKR